MIVKVNLNDQVKFKLTDRGKDIYFHQYDELNEYLKQKIGVKPFGQKMPEVDDDEYTKMQLWSFIEMFGKHIGIAKPNVIEPLNLYFETNEEDIE